MEVQNGKLKQLADVLAALGESKTPRTLVRFVAENTRALQPVAVKVQELSRVPEAFRVFVRKRDLLLADIPGAPQVDSMVRAEALARLEAEYSDALVERRYLVDALNEFLEDATEIQLCSVHSSDIPEGLLSGNMAAVLECLGLIDWDE